MPKKSSKKSASSAKSVEPKPVVAGLAEDGTLKFDGHQCYFFGDERLIPVKSLKEAQGKTVWYRESMFANIKPIEVP